jgi:hypothetical protein
MRLSDAKQSLSHIVRFAIPWNTTFFGSFDRMSCQEDVDLDVFTAAGGMLI